MNSDRPAALSEESGYPTAMLRWLIIAAVMIAAFIPVIDATIVNVAVPHMQAALGTTPDSIIWVLTSYMLTLGVATPITGWLEGRIGRRKLFTFSIAGFTIASALCGAATSLEMMVAARALQGICGAFIAPLGQATMLDSSPPSKHAQAMTIWGGGIMIGPIMGPVLGGWITDNLGWRWVFYVNLPAGIVATAMAWLLIRDRETPRDRFDGTGFILIALSLTAFQLFLDRGSQQDWFDSIEIMIEAGIAIGCMWMFVIHNMTTASPLLPRVLFRDPNYVLGTVFSMVATALLMALSALIAPMLQRLMGYDAVGAGAMMMPRGVGGLLSMVVAGRLAGKVDPRILVGIGFALTAISLRPLVGLDLDVDRNPFVLSGVLQGFAIGLTFMPLNLLAFSTIPPEQRTAAASLYNLCRNLAASVMISITSALLVRNLQINHSELAGGMASSEMTQAAQILAPLAPAGAVAAAMDAEVNRQALMIAYLDNYLLMTWLAVMTIPFVPFLRRPRKGQDAPPLAME